MNNVITYVVAGKNNIAVDTLSYLLKKVDRKEIKVVINTTDTFVDTWQRSLGKFAINNCIEIIELINCYHIPNLVFLSLEFDKIISPSLFNKDAKLINIHFSKLPSYKGMYTSVMPILNGESETGVTLHYIDHGIDTGDIIDQEIFLIGKDDLASNVYQKYLSHGTSLVIKNLGRIDELVGKPQGYLNSSYYSKHTIDFSQISINLNTTAINIVNQIRAYSFRVYQLPEVFSEKICGAIVLPERSTEKPGTIINNLEDSIIVSSIDYNVMLFKDRFDNLINCIRNNDICGVNKLIRNRFLINERTEIKGWSPLIIALYNNYHEIVKLLLENGADYNLCNYNGTTPLMYAKDGWINSNNSSSFDLLLRYGVDVYIVDYNNKNLLDYLKHKDSGYYNIAIKKINERQ